MGHTGNHPHYRCYSSKMSSIDEDGGLVYQRLPCSSIRQKLLNIEPIKWPPPDKDRLVHEFKGCGQDHRVPQKGGLDIIYIGMRYSAQMV